VPAFALIHSPLVGPVTWSAVADELSRRQVGVVVPDLGAPVESETGPHWKRHVALAARAIATVPAAASVVLVGHSGAGALLPAIRDAMDRACAGYIFVDAGLPSSNAKGRVDSLDTSTRFTRGASVSLIGPTRICATRSPFPPSGPRC
jgi:hypothetical protein